MKCFWKEASTLILIALKKLPVDSNCNYKLLTLQRSWKSSFMPNGYVFPGGTTDPADSDKKWLDVFSHFSLDVSHAIKQTEKIPPIVANKTGDVPKLLSLKITAIRETFEETGILLCKHKNKDPTDSMWASFSTFKDLEFWRAKIQKDARQFYNLCRSCNCCPDLNSLYLWSNWLTPTSMGNQRFDAAFFIACLSETPAAGADEMEIQKLSWVTPNELMTLCKIKDIHLPPPQMYEIARLLQFKDIKVLNDFAIKRSFQGCERWMPIQIKTTDGFVSLLPGDEAYNFSDYCTPTKPKHVKMSSEEFRNQYKVLHRMEFMDKIKTKVVVKNYTPTYGHVLPVNESLLEN